MLKILHINCSSTGSTGKIIADIAEHTSSFGYEHLLCTPGVAGSSNFVRYIRTSLPYEQGIYRRLNYVYGFQYGLAPLSTAKIKNWIKKEKPDLIHLHCINGFMVNAYSLLTYIKKLQIPTVITNHAEFFYTGSCPHAYDCEKWRTGCGECPQRYLATGGKLIDTSAKAWERMRKSFFELKKAVMVSVSPWVSGRAQQSPITSGLMHEVVLNGANTSVFAYRDAAALREKYGFLQTQKILFHPTANFSDAEEDRKGGRFVIEVAKRLRDEGVKVLVAGKYAPNMNLPDNVVLLGQISDQRVLAEYYALADVTLVVGKRETFNMPVAESLCCGTPVVGFLAGGPESIAIEQFSAFSPFGDVDSLVCDVKAFFEKIYEKSEIAKQGKEKYSAAVMATAYMNIYNKLLKE